MLKILRKKSAKKDLPYQGLSVRERTYFGEETKGDLYHMGVGDTIRVCFNYLDWASERKDFDWHNFIYQGHRFGRDYFVILDKDDLKIKKFSEEKRARGHEKRRDLIRFAFEHTPACDYM